MKKKAIIVDLDGTLCDVNHRVEFVRKVPIDWDGFNSRLSADKLNRWCFEIVDAMKSRGTEIYFITGRGEDYRALTEDWLAGHHIVYNGLYMRAKNDFREDADIKEDLYREHLEKTHEILFVIDDRLSVVRRWRELGLVCLQCDWGDF